MKASRYTVLRRRRTEWRKELQREKPRYPLKLIRATIASINAEMIECLKERSP
jgi:hypothetical protein